MRTPFCLRSALAVLAALALAGCATQTKPYDYSAFREAKPASLLVLPPLNESPDIKASPALWSHATLPLSEAGYYVLPVTLVDETLRQNGVQTADDAHSISGAKLREVFGADAAVYLKVTQYGTSYRVVSSETAVSVSARIVDLRTGTQLWEGSARASSAEQSQQSQGGLLGMLVTAVMTQIVNSATDAAYGYGAIASGRLFSPARNAGILPGPRLSPQK